ncbi:dTDP-4-dehydrorhamnose 3,5-epimerase [Planococcus halocryophilus Or1]|uniref:dTDP-4-dehydrorhamnose 3,5-epimerase n=1 Tax=Planococcus halocryophilus TaxID=1215089 RepID=A0A1C7DRD6_9BACL|nr:dTDP-4-dehydrorhamnose 3,5-epimerase [Planococcus halocryophilus]ANU13952.1 dTDP-4-dehydrorhamnose 3,5-epimerase [Planococcus halocryophilus]EMF47450.1 dTDP-4-dehydrorhamnose 3,5-epimerase [Planococcus halocryophilus Or1]
MNFIKTKLSGVLIIEPTIFGDHRGWFTENYNRESFGKAGLDLKFIQDNHSFSAKKGTLRGLHYQLAPKSQTKLVRCTKGSIFDVAVDIRKESSTYGEWFGIELTAENKKQLLVPKGFAHAFMTLEDNVEVQYKVDELYSPENDRGIIWNDLDIAIEWPLEVEPTLSSKDEKASLLKDADNNFTFGAE